MQSDTGVWRTAQKTAIQPGEAVQSPRPAYAARNASRAGMSPLRRTGTRCAHRSPKDRRGTRSPTNIRVSAGYRLEQVYRTSSSLPP